MTQVKASYTLGPWETSNVDPQRRKSGKVVVFAKTGGDVAWLPTNGAIDDDEREANAHLIAAAPDMLKALEMAESSLTNSVVHNEGGIARQVNLDIVRAAIKKARGE